VTRQPDNSLHNHKGGESLAVEGLAKWETAFRQRLPTFFDQGSMASGGVTLPVRCDTGGLTSPLAAGLADCMRTAV
jgi:hypothetical protein